MDGTNELDEFIRKSDRKSLYNQIKSLVVKAKDITRNELKDRRKRLKTLLDYEDKIYEEEFANKVKSRIDEDIQARKNALLMIKEENRQSAAKFLEKKRIQQFMETCYEIRESLRHKEQYNVKNCQLEQMVENERSARREMEMDKYWQEVGQKNMDVYDERQRNEQCLKRKLIQQNRMILDVQMLEKAEKAEEVKKTKLAEAEELAKVLEEIRLEEFDLRQLGMPVKTLKYRKELLDMIAESKERKRSEACEKAREHLAMMIEVKRLEEEEAVATHARKIAFNQATMDYISYLKRMRKLEADRERQRNDRIDDLLHVDICTKNNIQAEAKRKADVAALCYKELKKQVCEQYERRLRDSLERREDKMMENRFAPPNITRAEIHAQRRRNREGLDQQIEDLRKYRALEEEKLQKDMLRAINDPEYCTELAELYIREGIDYLEPHANWRIYACPQKNYVAKPPSEWKTNTPGEGASNCLQPCGCDARQNQNCSLQRGKPESATCSFRKPK